MLASYIIRVVLMTVHWQKERGNGFAGVQSTYSKLEQEGSQARRRMTDCKTEAKPED